MQRDPLPLIANYSPEAVLAWRHGKVHTQREFLSAVILLTSRMPSTGYVINLCRDRYNFMLGFCAGLLQGCVSLLPPNRQNDTVLEIAAEYPGSICLVDEAVTLDLPTVTIGQEQGEAEKDPALPMVSANRLAAIAFTSGSTGRPMPNSKPWHTLCGTARMLARRFVEVGESPTVVATVPSQHMYGLEMTVMLALQGGCALSSSQPFYVEDVAGALSEAGQPCLLVTTPVHLRHLVAGTLEMPAVGRVVSATAPLQSELAMAAENTFGARVEEIFGCTEAGSMATRRSVGDEHWQLLDGMQISEGKNGISVTGPHLDGVTLLQDRMEILAPDRFRFIGRGSDTINVGGKRASLADLTSKLLALESVSDGVVFMPSGKAERPAALVVTEEDERTVLRQLARRVDPVLLPRPLKKVGRIPRNETGKPAVALLQAALERREDV